MNSLFQTVRLRLLKRKIQKQLDPNRYHVTNINFSKEDLPKDWVYLTPVGEYGHQRQDCPCGPALIHKTREDGRDLWIMRHNQMDV